MLGVGDVLGVGGAAGVSGAGAAEDSVSGVGSWRAVGSQESAVASRVDGKRISDSATAASRMRTTSVVQESDRGSGLWSIRRSQIIPLSGSWGQGKSWVAALRAATRLPASALRQVTENPAARFPGRRRGCPPADKVHQLTTPGGHRA